MQLRHAWSTSIGENRRNSASTLVPAYGLDWPGSIMQRVRD